MAKVGPVIGRCKRISGVALEITRETKRTCAFNRRFRVCWLGCLRRGCRRACRCIVDRHRLDSGLGLLQVYCAGRVLAQFENKPVYPSRRQKFLRCFGLVCVAVWAGQDFEPRPARCVRRDFQDGYAEVCREFRSVGRINRVLECPDLDGIFGTASGCVDRNSDSEQNQDENAEFARRFQWFDLE